jgi:hypothetical protein
VHIATSSGSLFCAAADKQNMPPPSPGLDFYPHLPALRTNLLSAAQNSEKIQRRKFAVLEIKQCPPGMHI